MGAGCLEKEPRDQAVETFSDRPPPPPPLPPGGERGCMLNGSLMANDLIDYSYVMKPKRMDFGELPG